VVRREEDAGVDGAFVRIASGHGVAIRATFHDVARAIEPEPAFGLDDLPGRVLVGSAVAIHTVFGEDGPKLEWLVSEIKSNMATCQFFPNHVDIC
jgi:hypothetical protein